MLNAATGAGTATSAAFNITAGTATQLVFSVQPSTTPAGAAITPAVQVTAQDAQGNAATGVTGDVTVAIGTNPGTGTLGGERTPAAVGGADRRAPDVARARRSTSRRGRRHSWCSRCSRAPRPQGRRSRRRCR